MSLKPTGRRSTSRLPDLVTLIPSRPPIAAPLAATERKVSPQAVEGMLREPGGLRDRTGRSRINLAAARRFGRTVPAALLGRADEVIEQDPALEFCTRAHFKALSSRRRREELALRAMHPAGRGDPRGRGSSEWPALWRSGR